jgi:hypothetical protein
MSGCLLAYLPYRYMYSDSRDRFGLMLPSVSVDAGLNWIRKLSRKRNGPKSNREMQNSSARRLIWLRASGYHFSSVPASLFLPALPTIEQCVLTFSGWNNSESCLSWQGVGGSIWGLATPVQFLVRRRRREGRAGHGEAGETAFSPTHHLLTTSLTAITRRPVSLSLGIQLQPNPPLLFISLMGCNSTPSRANLEFGQRRERPWHIGYVESEDTASG